MLKWFSKRRAKKRGHAKQPGADQLYSSTLGSAGTASTSDPPYRTSIASSPDPTLDYPITQTGNAHIRISSPELNTVAAQYGTTRDLRSSPHRFHPTALSTEHRHLLLPSTTAQQHQPPLPLTGTPSSTAPVSTPHQDRSSSEPVFQFEGTNMRAIAGGDIASKNILQQGNGNHIHINSTEAIDEHELLLRRIEKKLGSYVASDAVLSKDVHGDPSVCYQGTRDGLLRHVLSWVEGSPAKSEKDFNDVASRALCIVGAPGSGKSTIMNTLIVKLLRDATHRSPGLIAAHYCIRRSLQSTTDNNKVLPTLILQLARRDPRVAKQIATLLEEALHTNVFTPELQEEVFLKAISVHDQVVFVIIDALDEALKPASLAATLSRVIPHSTLNLRLLLATRNEHGVLHGLGTGLIPEIVHEIPTEESLSEVGAYIAHRLRDGVHEIFGDSPAWRFWPDDSQLRSLSDRAGGLFVWARTAVDYILSRIQRRGLANRDRWIEDVGTLGLADVNNLYLFILEKQLEGEKDDSQAEDAHLIQVQMTGVFGFIIVAEHPLALDVLAGFFDLNDFDLTHFVSLARSILVPGTEPITGSTIPQMHKTFFDFITCERASVFRIDTKHHHCQAADRCFAVMASKLKFNIAGLRSSFSNHDDLGKIADVIPHFISYASTLWWYHLDNADADQLPSDITHIRAFLENKLLFWIEIVVILKKREEAQNWLLDLGERLSHRQSGSGTGQLDLADFTQDASTLLGKFEECITASIPHIYISLLAFSPGDSVVAKHYQKRNATAVIPHSFGMPLQWNSWDADPRMANNGSVWSISFSPCGRRLAAGYGGNSVRVWNVETGECVIEPLEGHSDGVNSVCFSPSGLLIASGSDDKTIRVWDAETGKCILGPLTGHTKSIIWSVSFSPDSTRIASGSWDQTIRVWDVRTGDCVLGPLEEHIGHMRSVSYSPDGSCIASNSGSADKTIRLWNAQTGECIGGPLSGHGSRIYSLSFHPDGRWLVSGSYDENLRIWDIHKGTCTHGPLTGHNNTVWSVCFSPDGRYIASGSQDRTIRIWDAETATACVAGPFGGVSHWVSSVAFSPDGQYLAAGSFDGTVRLWNFKALLTAGLRDSCTEDEASTRVEITDHTAAEKGAEGWTLGPSGERLFWAPKPFHSAIWRPSTVRILGRPNMIKPDLSNLVTGEEWLSCFPSS